MQNLRVAIPSLLSFVIASAEPALGGSLLTCGDVAEPAGVLASDALATLQAAVETRTCSLCSCDANGSDTITAPDALLVLKAAIGQKVVLACPFCCFACECTPQTLTLTTGGIAPCEGCIPRVPASNSTVDSITIEFADVLNDEFELEAVAECEWLGAIPGAIVEKTFYGSSDTTCSSSPVPAGAPAVEIRVVRTESGWEVLAGQYPSSLDWGDVLRATVNSGGCDAGGSAPSENEMCELAEVGNPTDYDVHATGGSVTIEISDDEPACP